MDRYERWLAERVEYLQHKIEDGHSLFYVTCHELLLGVLSKYRQHKKGSKEEKKIAPGGNGESDSGED